MVKKLEDHLQRSIIAIGKWYENTWDQVDRVEHAKYHKEASNLLVLAGAYYCLLTDCLEDLDEESISFIIYTIISIFSLLKSQIKSFRKKDFTSLNLVEQKKIIACLVDTRAKLISDFKILIDQQGLSG